MGKKEFLSAAVLYMAPDGTKKLCGDRCGLHIEEGPNKNRCLILGKEMEVPNTSTCNLYSKGNPANSDQEFLDPQDPEKIGYTQGPAQCKNCVSANEDVSVCLLLTSVLKKLYNMDNDFGIDPEGCCNAMNPKKSMMASKIIEKFIKF